MLELQSINAAAGAFRLQDVSLQLATGEFHAILGPSGSGKTTLLKTVLGVLAPASGRILLNGEDITEMAIERRGLGYVPQQLGLFPHLTVRENIAYSARARGICTTEFQVHLDRLIDATGIGSLLSSFPPTLSGGERQRVGLVRALASQPKLTLLDEPFTALDENLRRELWHLLIELRQQQGLTILFVTHHLTEAHFLADRVSVLLDGRIAQQDATMAVFERPASSAIARLLGVENLLPTRVLEIAQGLATIEIDGVRLLARAPDPVRDQMLACIRAEDVILQGTSHASNGLHAEVLALQPGRPMTELQLDVGFPLQASATRATCEALALRQGAQVQVHIPPAAIHMIPWEKHV